MPTHSIQNQTPSILDMSPLHDVAGKIITLKPLGKAGDTAEVDDETLGNPVMQRVIAMKWLSITAGSQGVSAAPAAPAANVPAAEVEAVVAEAPKAEPTVETHAAPPAPAAETPAEPAPVAPVAETPAEPVVEAPPTSSIPVETSTSSETPMRSGKTLPPKNKSK